MLTSPMLVSLLLLAPCVPSLGLSPGPGSLVLVGGGLREDNTAVWRSMVQLAGGDQVGGAGHRRLQEAVCRWPGWGSSPRPTPTPPTRASTGSTCSSGTQGHQLALVSSS